MCSWSVSQSYTACLRPACRCRRQLAMLERDYGDREARELWPRLQRRLPDLFRNIAVTPALLHGDLHSGNTAETDDQPGNRETAR